MMNQIIGMFPNMNSWQAALTQLMGASLNDSMETQHWLSSTLGLMNKAGAGAFAEQMKLQDPLHPAKPGMKDFKRKREINNLKKQNGLYQRLEKNLRDQQGKISRDHLASENETAQNLQQSTVAEQLSGLSNSGMAPVAPQEFWQGLRLIKEEARSTERAAKDQMNQSASNANSYLDRSNNLITRALKKLGLLNILKKIMPFVQAALTMLGGVWASLGSKLLSSVAGKFLNTFLNQVWNQIYAMVAQSFMGALMQKPAGDAQDLMQENSVMQNHIQAKQGQLHGLGTREQNNLLKQSQEWQNA